MIAGLWRWLPPPLVPFLRAGGSRGGVNVPHDLCKTPGLLSADGEKKTWGLCLPCESVPPCRQTEVCDA